MVQREIKILYKQTILGFSWAVLRPLISMVIFTFIFGGLAKIPSDGIPYPIFSFTALVPWLYFSTSLTKSTVSLVSGSSIINKVYFPRLIIPLTPALAGMIDFFISFVIIIFLMFYFSMLPTINIIYIPVLVFLMFLTSSGVGFWLSALAIQYRDVKHAIQFLAQILMYVAPVVWPLSIVSEKYGNEVVLLYAIYPMVGVIEGFRSSLLNHNQMPWDLILIGFISSSIIFFSGMRYFLKKQLIFSDVA